MDKVISGVPEQKRVLVMDDDTKLLDLLVEYLARFGIEVIPASDPLKGLEMLPGSQADMVVLDVMMPGIDGFEVCRRIRKENDIPILMLSARGETMDRIVGLELGADDYMAKPFEPRELVTRIQAILRRSSRSPAKTGGVLRFGDLELRQHEREAYLDGQALGLSVMEFDCLYLLAHSPGRKFSRDEIMNQLQGVDSASFSRSIDILVSRLRSKIGDDAKTPRFIKSVHGLGYVFVGINS